jgi:murein L,D-transpeptidase YafK
MQRLIFIILLSLLQISCATNKKNTIAPGSWKKAIKSAVTRYGKPQESQLVSYFDNAGVSYPPKAISLLAFKQEKQLQLWASDANSKWRYVHTYPLTAFSGKLGPKLKENDYQIPEGIYDITSLNPFSSLHLSMMLNYPNASDRRHAEQDKRKNLGNNIFIHGKSVSVGCLAIGDKAIDQLFLLVHKVGKNNTKVIISPVDFRKRKLPKQNKSKPQWLPALYAQISNELAQFS